MKFTTSALAAALFLAAPAALAQDAPQPPKADKTDWAARMNERHAEMCSNHYAHAVGKFAELEVRLKLTSVQKPLFERWKNVKLTAVKANSQKCEDMKPLGRDASILDHRKRQIAMLETRLADLKAETPALEALVKSLDANQVNTLKRMGHDQRMMRMHMAERFMDHRGPMMRGMGPMGGMPGDRPMRGDRPGQGAND